jgi:hypothetical protein
MCAYGGDDLPQSQQPTLDDKMDLTVPRLFNGSSPGRCIGGVVALIC